jgi:hypothetical protein
MTEEKKISLYNISERLLEVEQKIALLGGEVDDDVEEILSEISLELSTKVDGVVDYIKSKSNHIDEIKKREGELKDLRTVEENSLDRFKEYVVTCMGRMKAKKLEGKYSRISKRKPLKKLSIADKNQIPIEFIEIIETSKIDTAEIKKRLKTGENIPGAKLVDGVEGLLIK